MSFLNIAPPPGVVKNGTDLQQANTWSDANLVRWYEGALLIIEKPPPEPNARVGTSSPPTLSPSNHVEPTAVTHSEIAGYDARILGW